MLQVCKAFVCKIVIFSHSLHFRTHLLHVLSHWFNLVSSESLGCITKLITFLGSSRFIEICHSAYWFSTIVHLILDEPRHLIIELIMHQVDKGLRGLMAENFILVWDTRSHVVNFAYNLLTVSDQLTFIV